MVPAVAGVSAVASIPSDGAARDAYVSSALPLALLLAML
jgi:hypothetical protein